MFRSPHGSHHPRERPSSSLQLAIFPLYPPLAPQAFWLFLKPTIHFLPQGLCTACALRPFCSSTTSRLHSHFPDSPAPESLPGLAPTKVRLPVTQAGHPGLFPNPLPCGHFASPQEVRPFCHRPDRDSVQVAPCLCCGPAPSAEPRRRAGVWGGPKTRSSREQAAKDSCSCSSLSTL